MNRQKTSLIILIISALILGSCSEKKSISEDDVINYSDTKNWAFYPQTDTAEMDVFFVAPTVFGGDSAHLNMSLNDEESKTNFTGAIQMEKNIYHSDITNFYAPFYKQVGLISYQLSNNNSETLRPQLEKAFQTAYTDVESAFDYYLSQSNRPFILAGFSQGSQILIELIKNKLTTTDLQHRHIATYAIGWRLTSSDVDSFPQLINAQSSDDLGVVITYSSEAEFVDASFIVPQKTLSINPLSWSTDTVFASNELNKGACFTNYSGEIISEIPYFTGAYICSKRGTLKVPDVDADEYPPQISIFQRGEYHIYDYMFFYRNLQENVLLRIEKYQSRNKKNNKI
jgi:hypothetical protein